MIGRKAVVGLCLLCALALSAFAPQGASAASNGTTLFTCKVPTGSDPAPVGQKFNKAHCKDKATDNDTDASGTFRHVPFNQDVTTEITGTSENTAGVCEESILRSTQSGVEEEMRSPCSHILPEVGGVKSWVTNKVDATTGEHYYEGEAWLDYTNVEVVKPAEKECKLKNPTLLWHLKFTTLGQGDKVKVSPATGEKFVEFEIAGCTIAALNGKYDIKGSYLVEPNGATLSTTEADVTAQGTLKKRGQTFGIAGTMTLKGKAPADAVDSALSPTTVSTP